MYARSESFLAVPVSKFPERAALAELFEVLHASLLQRDFHKATSTLSVLVYRFNHSPQLILRACVETLRTEVLEPARHRTVVLRFFRILLATKRKGLFATALVEMVRFFLSKDDFEDARHTLAEYSRVPRFAASASLIASLQGLVEFSQWKSMRSDTSSVHNEFRVKSETTDVAIGKMASPESSGSGLRTEECKVGDDRPLTSSNISFSFLGEDEEDDSDDDFVSSRSRGPLGPPIFPPETTLAKYRDEAIRFFFISFANAPNGLDASHLVDLLLARNDVQDAKNVIATWRTADGANPEVYRLLLAVLRDHCPDDHESRMEAARNLLQLDPISIEAILEFKNLLKRKFLSDATCREILQPCLDYSHLVTEKNTQEFLKAIFC